MSRLPYADDPPVKQGPRFTRSETWRQRYDEAAAARQAFAEQHGCKDFAEVMQRGIQHVGKSR